MTGGTARDLVWKNTTCTRASVGGRYVRVSVSLRQDCNTALLNDTGSLIVSFVPNIVSK